MSDPTVIFSEFSTDGTIHIHNKDPLVLQMDIDCFIDSQTDNLEPIENYFIMP